MMASNSYDRRVHKDFKVWLRDRQVRACFGTVELDTRRANRKDLADNGIQTRVHELLRTLKEAGISLNQGAITYNAKYQRSQAFHLKYCLPPEVYVKIFCPALKLPIPSDRAIVEERFKRDFYADRLQEIAREDVANQVDLVPGRLVTAPIKDLPQMGALVLCMRLFTLGEINDGVSQLEKDIQTVFGDVWYSVCLFVNSGDEIDSANFHIGAKIDEHKFLKVMQSLVAIPDDIRRDFNSKNAYAPPRRTYHEERTAPPGKKKPRFNVVS